ncbi:FtsW/RodA/SpoVE family cell cycle protein [Rossellomorea sp. GCM10028870]|uniref:FtsW/RodA/SpoVE family cell cycle protein n=1 Tax=Rossellomorea sp. GCM10028870 TaxID=3273426 RepID=UPI00361F241E
MSEKKVDYLNRVIRHVRSKEAKRFVAEELHHHLEEEMRSLKIAGMDGRDAEEKAIKQMGSAERLGMEMNRLHRPKVDWLMIGLVLLISLIGILPSLHVSEELYNDTGYLFKKIIYLIFGAVISLGLMFFDYRKLRTLKWGIYGTTAMILISLTVMPNFYINGEAHFRLASFTIDSTTAVTALVLSWIIFLGSSKKALWWVLPFLAVSLSSLMMLPSIPAAFVFTLTVTVLLWIRFKDKRKYMVWGYAVIGVFIGTMISNAEPYQLERVNAFIHPEDYGSHLGYMYLRNHELLARGGWFGEPGGREVISDPHTSFALTTVTYHYGWIASGVLILTGLFIMFRMLRHIQMIKDLLGQMIILGGVTLFSTQFLYNIGMTLGLLPHTGMSLPFVSYGLNPTIQTFMVVGLFLSVYRRKNLISYRETEKG